MHASHAVRYAYHQSRAGCVDVGRERQAAPAHRDCPPNSAAIAAEFKHCACHDTQIEQLTRALTLVGDATALVAAARLPCCPPPVPPAVTLSRNVDILDWPMAVRGWCTRALQGAHRPTHTRSSCSKHYTSYTHAGSNRCGCGVVLRTASAHAPRHRRQSSAPPRAASRRRVWPGSVYSTECMASRHSELNWQG